MPSPGAQPPRIGLIGSGNVVQRLHARFTDATTGPALAFVHARRPAGLDFVSPDLRLADLGEFAAFAPTLVVEAAHPDVTRMHGEAILAVCDYMPMSTTALADPGRLASLTAAANAAGTRLLVPHGAVVGLDSLIEWRDAWDSVTITFRKPPRAIDFSASGIDPAGITGETLLYDGPVGALAPRFPRNVNAMVTCALATVGLDRCRGRLIADPAATMLSLEIVAIDRDGAELRIERRQPAVGVSGSEMFAALLRSIDGVTGVRSALAFV